MQNKEKDIKLTDIISLDFLQKFQDSFSSYANVASVIIDKDGQVTKPTNFTTFCDKLTRGSKEGLRRCEDCDKKCGILASITGKPMIYTCHSGLTDFAVPIIVEDRQIASIYGGQILTETPNEEKFRALANELGIDEDEYIKALKDVRIVPEKQIKAAAELLFVVANSISQLASTNYQLQKENNENQKRNKQNEILKRVMETSRSSLEIKDVTQNLIKEIGKSFNADRCYFRAYDKVKDLFFAPEAEYIAKPELNSLIDVKPNQKALKYFSKELYERKKGFYPIHIDENTDSEDLKKYMQDVGIAEIYACPIIDIDDECVWLVLHYVEKNQNFDESYRKLLELIAYNIDASIKQLKLYNTIKKTAEKESVLRKITSTSVTDVKTEDVIHAVITETGKMFNANRCFFVEVDLKHEMHKPIKEYAEYLSEDGIKTHLSIETDCPETIEYMKLGNKGKIKLVENINDEHFSEAGKKMFIDELSLKSFCIAPVIFGDKHYGSIVLHYVKEYKSFKKEEIELLEIIANQAAAVIHQAELYQTIQKNEEYTRAVVENITDGIITIDDDFIIQSANSVVKEIWGWSPQECLAKPLDMILNYNCTGKKKKDCLTSKSVYGIKKDGTKFSVEISVSDITTEEKTNVMLVIRDITERKRIEQMKNEFVSTVSHELRTPLTSLKGSLGLISSGKMGDLSEKIKALLDIANNNCARLINLINDILDIEKIEAGKMDFEILPHELMPLINQAIGLNTQFAQKYSVKINLTNKIENVMINVDSNRFIQIITNLLSNAIKFTKPESFVNITLSEIENKIKISITNYGEAIPEEFRNRIFQKFAQSDSSDSRQKGGTGLGLSISKAIVEKMNGNINFSSNEKETVFYFDIPKIIDCNKGNVNNEETCINL